MDIPSKIGPNTEAARELETANIFLYEWNKVNKILLKTFYRINSYIHLQRHEIQENIQILSDTIHRSYLTSV